MHNKCKLKVNGLPDDHPEKSGVLIDMANLEEEVKRKIAELNGTASITNGVSAVSV